MKLLIYYENHMTSVLLSYKYMFPLTKIKIIVSTCKLYWNNEISYFLWVLWIYNTFYY